MRAEDWLEVNVMLEAEPSALRNPEPIQGTGIKARGLGRCVLNVLVLHVTTCRIAPYSYYGSKNQYTVAIFF